MYTIYVLNLSSSFIYQYVKRTMTRASDGIKYLASWIKLWLNSYFVCRYSQYKLKPMQWNADSNTFTYILKNKNNNLFRIWNFRVNVLSKKFSDLFFLWSGFVYNLILQILLLYNHTYPQKQEEVLKRRKILSIKKKKESKSFVKYLIEFLK